MEFKLECVKCGARVTVDESAVKWAGHELACGEHGGSEGCTGRLADISWREEE